MDGATLVTDVPGKVVTRRDPEAYRGTAVRAEVHGSRGSVCTGMILNQGASSAVCLFHLVALYLKAGAHRPITLKAQLCAAKFDWIRHGFAD